MSTVTPYVMVQSATDFHDFLTAAFDAEVRNVVPLPSDPQRVMHAEAQIGTGVLFFADSGADGRQCLEQPTDPVHVQLYLTLPDPEHTYRRAVAAGATPVLDVADQGDGTKMGGFVAFGALWWMTGR